MQENVCTTRVERWRASLKREWMLFWRNQWRMVVSHPSACFLSLNVLNRLCSCCIKRQWIIVTVNLHGVLNSGPIYKRCENLCQIYIPRINNSYQHFARWKFVARRFASLMIPGFFLFLLFLGKTKNSIWLFFFVFVPFFNHFSSFALTEVIVDTDSAIDEPLDNRFWIT